MEQFRHQGQSPHIRQSLRLSALSARLKENNMTENEVSYEVRGASL